MYVVESGPVTSRGAGTRIYILISEVRYFAALNAKVSLEFEIKQQFYCYKKLTFSKIEHPQPLSFVDLNTIKLTNDLENKNSIDKLTSWTIDTKNKNNY